MKKLFALLLAFILVLSMYACDMQTDGSDASTIPADRNTESTAGETNISQTENTTEEPTAETTTEATIAPTTAPTTAPTEAPATEPPHTHSFSAATCTAPKTCSCGATSGNALGHSWSDATCTAPKTCTSCSATEGSAAGHKYTNGSCSVCGASDPNYTTLTYVLNVKSKKFHKLSCHKLPTDNRQDTAMSRGEIINAGYEPCKLCNP